MKYKLDKVICFIYLINRSIKKGLNMSNLTKEQILLDTIKWLASPDFKQCVDPTGSCIYSDGEGNNCAIGRYLKPEYKIAANLPFEGDRAVYVLKHYPEYFGESIVEFSKDNESFIRNIQTLHDNADTSSKLDQIDVLKHMGTAYKIVNEVIEQCVKLISEQGA